MVGRWMLEYWVLFFVVVWFIQDVWAYRLHVHLPELKNKVMKKKLSSNNIIHRNITFQQMRTRKKTVQTKSRTNLQVKDLVKLFESIQVSGKKEQILIKRKKNQDSKVIENNTDTAKLLDPFDFNMIDIFKKRKTSSYKSCFDSTSCKASELKRCSFLIDPYLPHLPKSKMDSEVLKTSWGSPESLQGPATAKPSNRKNHFTFERPSQENATSHAITTPVSPIFQFVPSRFKSTSRAVTPCSPSDSPATTSSPTSPTDSDMGTLLSMDRAVRVEFTTYSGAAPTTAPVSCS